MAMKTLTVHSSYSSSNYGYCQAANGSWQANSTSSSYNCKVICVDKSSNNSYRMYIKIPSQTVFAKSENNKITNINISLNANVGSNSGTAKLDVYLVDSVDGYQVSGTPSLKLGTVNIPTSSSVSVDIPYTTTSAFDGTKYLLFIRNSSSSGDNYKQIRCDSTAYPKVTFTYYEPYTVTYNANGGTGAPSKQTKIYGDNLTLSGTAPTKSNGTSTYTITYNGNGGTVTPTSKTQTNTVTYTFANWNTKADGSGTSYSARETYSTDSDITLYAQYTATTIPGSVILSVTSASRPNAEVLGGVITFDTGIAGTKIDTMATSRTAKYTHSGWKNNSSGTTFTVGQTATFTGDRTIHAQWTASYTDIAVKLPTLSNITGYTFGGWKNSSGTKVNSDAFTTSTNVTLYAIWNPVNVTITLNAKDGYFGSSTSTKTKTITIPYKSTYAKAFETANIPKRSSFTFDTWTSDTENLNKITKDTVVTNLNAHTIYAHYASGYYVVSYIYHNKQWVEITNLASTDL